MADGLLRGMEAKGRRDPAWTRDELILICEVLQGNGWQQIRAHQPEAIELSKILRALPLHPLSVRTAKFRSPSSVQRKSGDIISQTPGYSGVPTKGGHLDKEVLEFFLAAPAVANLAARKLAKLKDSTPDLPEMIEEESPEEAEAPEGRILYRMHRVYERSRSLRLKKIQSTMQAESEISCEACSFNFAATYGAAGKGYIQVHHMMPLHESGPVTTRVADLALLCANCHVIAHRIRPWPSVQDLRVRLGR